MIASSPAGVGGRVDGALGARRLPLGGPGDEQVVAHEAVDRLVELRALADVDDLVLAALPQELLHPVRVHGLLGGEGEDGEGEAGALSHGSEDTSVIDTKTARVRSAAVVGHDGDRDRQW